MIDLPDTTKPETTSLLSKPRSEIVRQLQVAYQKYGFNPNESEVISQALATLVHIMLDGRFHLLDWNLIEQAIEPESCNDFRATVDEVQKHCAEYCLKLDEKPETHH